MQRYDCMHLAKAWTNKPDAALRLIVGAGCTQLSRGGQCQAAALNGPCLQQSHRHLSRQQHAFWLLLLLPDKVCLLLLSPQATDARPAAACVQVIHRTGEGP